MRSRPEPESDGPVGVCLGGCSDGGGKIGIGLGIGTDGGGTVVASSAGCLGITLALSTQDSILRYVNLLFSFALDQNYLPEGRPTACSGLKKAKVVSGDVGIFTPAQLTTILHAASPHIIPVLAIGAFSGIRMAELARLDWNAVNLERRIIEVRAGQAKTASCRIIPITDNLAAWLEPLPRHGKVLPARGLTREAAGLARALGTKWPINVLRHS